MSSAAELLQNPDEPLFQEGERFGDYNIIRRIGVGGMASVWLALHRPLNRLTAIKILRADLAEDERFVRRFIQEAQSAACLEHPSIVRIYEVGAIRVSSLTSFFSSLKNIGVRKFKRRRGRRIHYIAEEYACGTNLSAYVKRQGPLTPTQTLFVLRQVASALKCASDFGMIHRDIKPENILLSESGKVKVVDFGLASSLTEEVSDLTLTLPGIALGTPLYMSPEQAEGKPLDIRSDLYSLGMTAYWMLTGKVPFTGATPMAVLLRQINAEPVPPSSLRPEIPSSLENIVLRLLAKKPEERYASPDELTEVLRQAQRQIQGEESSSHSSSIPPVPQGIQTSASYSENSWETQDEAETLLLSQQVTAIQAAHSFQRTLDTQKRIQRTDKKPKFALNWRRGVITLLFTAAALLLGGIRGYFSAFSPSPNFSQNPSPPVEAFASVEEQWVFASQTDTSEAWEGVIRYYPQETYWTEKAQRRRAVALMREGRKKEALQIFKKYSDESNKDPWSQQFGQAGESWFWASEGKWNKAASLLSVCQNDSVSSDPLTREIIAQTSEMIRNRPQNLKNQKKTRKKAPFFS